MAETTELDDELVETVELAIRSLLLGDLDDDGPHRVAVVAINALLPWFESWHERNSMSFYACGLPPSRHPAPVPHPAATDPSEGGGGR